MKLDVKKYELIGESTWKLTKTEMKILKLFSDNAVHSQDQIFKKCNFKNVNTTRITIYRLRKKIPELEITLIAKAGYRLDTYLEVV